MFKQKNLKNIMSLLMVFGPNMMFAKNAFKKVFIALFFVGGGGDNDRLVP